MSDSQAGCTAGCIIVVIALAVGLVFDAIVAYALMVLGNFVLEWAQQPVRLDFGIAFAIVVILSLLGVVSGRK